MGLETVGSISDSLGVYWRQRSPEDWLPYPFIFLDWSRWARAMGIGLVLIYPHCVFFRLENASYYD